MRIGWFAAVLTGFMLGIVFIPSVGFGQIVSKSVGVRVGSDVWPTEYPFMLPPLVAEYGSISPVRSNIRFGLERMYHEDNGRRGAVLLTVDFGTYFTEVAIPIEVSRVRPLAKDISFVTTGSFGIGAQRYRGYSLERLDILYVPFHAGLGFEFAYTRFSTGIDLFFGYNLPVGQRYISAGGQSENAGVGVYPVVGVDLTMRFGGRRG